MQFQFQGLLTAAILATNVKKSAGWVCGMDGWSKSHLKDCLQQSKTT